MIHTLTKTIAVIVSSTILATLTVNAVDMRGHLAPAFLLALIFGAQEEESVCPEHMALVDQALEPFCVDVYEASVHESCMFDEPVSSEETMLNLARKECMAVSEPKAIPWRFIDMNSASVACSRAGKRLPNANEWYKAALGTTDVDKSFVEDQCNVARNRADGVAPTGDGMRCVSDVGAYDMIGNVWEWVEEEVVKGEWNERTLPGNGYVAMVDFAGIAHTTQTVPHDSFQHDRLWSDPTIVAGMMRGGYFDSKSNAGVNAVYAASPIDFTGDAVGFRCVSTPRATE